MTTEIERIRISLQANLEDTPDARACCMCGGRTKKVYLKYESGTDPVIVTDLLPGYECVDCGIEEIATAGVIELALEAKDKLREAGFDETADIFDDMLIRALQANEQEKD